VTRRSFEEAFDPDTYRSAAVAYYDAVLSFSPTPALPKAIFGTGEEVLRRRERYDGERECYELGGGVGIDPRDFTLRELTWLAAGRWDASPAWAVRGGDLAEPLNRPEKTAGRSRLTREQSADIHAENVALLRAAGPR
jgi:hypothetical protein